MLGIMKVGVDIWVVFGNGDVPRFDIVAA